MSKETNTYALISENDVLGAEAFIYEKVNHTPGKYKHIKTVRAWCAGEFNTPHTDVDIYEHSKIFTLSEWEEQKGFLCLTPDKGGEMCFRDYMWYENITYKEILGRLLNILKQLNEYD